MKRFRHLTLAALVAFAACDDGDDAVVQPDVTGTIAGAVTIEGQPAANVTVTLSNGQTATTDGSGAYSFAGILAGAYTVTIQGFATDATFAATSKAATISSTGQVVTVNFDGTFVRTSAIVGSVTVGGDGLEGVTVSIGTATTTTDPAGQFSFSGLKAGTFTVTLSGFDQTQYAFAQTSREVTVAVGESQVVSFNGLLLANASVTGSLFLDEGVRNGVFDGVQAEDKLAVANVKVFLEVAVGDTIEAVTDANGDYAFSDLEAGSYKAIFKATDPNIPGNVAFAGAPTAAFTLSAGATQAVNWGFTIVTQRLEAAAFLGTDADVSLTPGPGITPISGVTIQLYNTEANATAAGATGRLGSATSGADGTVTFRFARTSDSSPDGTADNIVFLRFAGTATPNKSLNGEAIIEVGFNQKDSSVTAPDTFDMLNTSLVLRHAANTAGNYTLGGWNTALWRNDTTSASIQAGATDATTGIGRFVEGTGPAALPDTFFVRLSGGQSFANTLGHGWRQAPVAAMGETRGSFLVLVHDGTQPDSVMLGTNQVTFTDQHLLGNVHHERDDSTDTPTYTLGDNIENVDNMQVELFSVAASGAKTSVGTTTGSIDSGAFVFNNAPIGNYELRVRSLAANQDVLNDTVLAVTLNGYWTDTTVAPLTGGKGKSTFAFKYNNGTITGTVRAADGTNADGLTVRVQPAADFIQPNVTDTTLTVTGGAYSLSGLREGTYTVTVSEGDSASVWELATFTGSGNTSASAGARDVQNNADSDIASFRTVRLDTKVLGVVINDRDMDFTVIDPDEALAGAELQLFKDNSGTPAVSADSLVATTTSDGNGAYMFDGLREGTYIVKWTAGTPTTNTDVLRGIAKDTAIVTTAATTTGLGANSTRTVGTKTPATLPRWNFNTSQADGGFLPNNFTFLFKNTRVTGTVVDGAAAAVAGMTISLRRCQTSAGAASPPVGGLTCTTVLGTTVNMVTGSDGKFSFDDLIEGVYEVRPQPGTVGGFSNSNPSSALYLTVGNADVEDLTFTVS